MSRVRLFVEDDIPQVADLNWKVFRKGKGTAPPLLLSYFRELFFHNPWFDKDLPSLVYEVDGGKIVGFLGLVPRRMSAQGKPIRVACASNFVVHPDSRSTLAGIDLLRAFLSGKQDLSLGDSANDLSRKVWTGLGGSTAVLSSIHWSRPLRPSQYALYVMSRLKTSRPLALLASACRPFCSVLDAFTARILSSPIRPSGAVFTQEEMDVETLLACLSEFSSSYMLHPEYDSLSLGWLLGFMTRMKAYGDLRTVVLRNREREIIGWYLYYIKRGGVGEVVQIGGGNHSIGVVLDHLFWDAWRHGAIALHGRLETRILPELSERNCFFYRRGDWTLVRSHRPELLQPIHSGEARLTRLDGEWCMAFGPG